jgi:pantothenate kinase type III
MSLAQYWLRFRSWTWGDINVASITMMAQYFQRSIRLSQIPFARLHSSIPQATRRAVNAGTLNKAVVPLKQLAHTI